MGTLPVKCPLKQKANNENDEFKVNLWREEKKE